MAKQPTQNSLTRKHLARMEKERLQQRNLLIGLGVVVVLIVAILLYGYLDQTFFKANRPVARVGTENISVGEYQKEVRFARYRQIEQLRSLVSDPMMAQFLGSYIQQIQQQLSSPTIIGQDVLDSMIEDRLVAREAEKRGITIDEAQLDQAVEEAFGFYANGTPTPTITPTEVAFSTATYSPTQLALVPPTATTAPTEDVTATPGADSETPAAETPAAETPAAEDATATPAADTATATPEVPPTITLTPTITPTPTQYTRDLYEENFNEYADAVKGIRINKADLREFIRRQMLRQKVYEAVTAEVGATGEQIWTRHILVATQEEAQAVIDRLNAGEKFEDLAAELSSDESNKNSGGDLGWNARGRMVTEFDDAAFALTEIGQISAPVQTSFGYHVIQLLGREERPMDPSQVQLAKDQAYQDWLETAKTETDVETYDSWVDAVPSDPEVPAELMIQIGQ